MKKTYRVANKKLIRGRSLPVFIKNLNYQLTEIHIYEDGKIDCQELTDFDGFVEKVQSGFITTSVPKDTKVMAYPLGNFQVKEFFTSRNEEDLIVEVKDIIDRFQGRKTTLQYCAEAFKVYIANPNPENKEHLSRTYSVVPAHNRCLILDNMAVEDLPIKAILYGAKVFKESPQAMHREKLIRDSYLKGIDL